MWSVKLIRTAILAAGHLFLLSSYGFAQSGPPPPAPIIETELKQNSIKIREIELERIKRDARKRGIDTGEQAREIRFRETKERFEGIQKRQDSIVKAYTHSRQIDYEEISRSAAEIYEDALWLNREVFGEKTDGRGEESAEAAVPRESVRDLIIVLDTAIGEFVKSPVFKGNTVVKKAAFEDAQKTLNRILELSRKLAAAASAADH
ncbi:MAG TPA: hypothetical protein VMM38_10585 [Aridibacter sp.]|nr:hypothetical protein [Aridibacter sp.]